MPPTPAGKKYALWLSGPGNRARWIGDARRSARTACCRSRARAQSDTTFTRDFAVYRQVLITLQTGTARKRPGPTLVRGTLPPRLASSFPGFMTPAGSQRSLTTRSTSCPSAPDLGRHPGRVVGADRVVVRDRAAGRDDRVRRRRASPLATARTGRRRSCAASAVK